MSKELTPIELENNLGPDVNGVVHHVPWKAYDVDEVDALLAKKDMEIFNLKEENSYIKADSAFDRDKHEELLKSKDKEIESLKASHYAEMVDAGMRERRLSRALWLARARSAHNAAMMWEILSDEYLNGAQFTIDFKCLGDPDVTEFQMFRGCMDWMEIYENVERKCRAKAEEFK